MRIVAIDNRDINVGIGQSLGSEKATESSANNDNVVTSTTALDVLYSHVRSPPETLGNECSAYTPKADAVALDHVRG